MNWWEFHWWYVPIWIAVLYLAASSYIITGKYKAVVEKLGDPYKEIGPGFYIYLRGFYKLYRYPRTIIADEVPADFEKIIRDDKSPVDKSKGEARAAWINHPRFDQALFFHQDPTPEERENARPSLTWADILKDDPERAKAIEHDAFQQRLTTEPNGPLSWRILDGGFVKFHTTVGSVEDARSRLFDEAISTIQDVCGKMTPGECIRTIEIISEYIERKLKNVVGQVDDPTMSHGKPWGVGIENFSIKMFYPGHDLNKIIRDQAGAEAKRREKIANGEAEARVTVMQGKAKAKAAKAVAAVIKTDEGQTARAYDVLETGFKNSNLIVASDAIGLAKTIGEALGTKKAS